ncbi:Tar ligand binding domain-containing protein [Paraburkholderia strydomiana]|uniref:Tar ligand binding domain-containing protein n=1 Tax=Paraburkholderia strydomiana TaxID=1245417 RepID=UPI0035B55F51
MRLRLDRVTAGQDVASPATLASAAALISESDRAWATYMAFTAGDEERRVQSQSGWFFRVW